MALANHFHDAVETVLHHEGGLVDHPDDPGGITNFGISLRWAVQTMVSHGDHALAALDVDADGDVDADDIRRMPRAKAIMAYRRFFWEPNGYSRLQDLEVATKVFDMCVNMGSRQAHRIAQRAVRAATNVSIADDGILGPITLAHLNDERADDLLIAMRSEQAGFYRALVIRNDALRRHGVDVPNFKRFENGWLRRAYS